MRFRILLALKINLHADKSAMTDAEEQALPEFTKMNFF